MVGEELFTIQRGWRRRAVYYSAEMEEKRCSTFSRVGKEVHCLARLEETFTVQ